MTTHLNIEIKARCERPEFIRAYLRGNNADFTGTDHQTDTYFNVTKGRLKMRQGNIENNLIYYERPDLPAAKESYFQLLKVGDAEELKEILTRALGVKTVVTKKREIYFIKNVKFHIDEVAGLGSFAEIEAGNLCSDVSKDELSKQCAFYLKAFEIRNEDLVATSYSDMLLLER